MATLILAFFVTRRKFGLPGLVESGIIIPTIFTTYTRRIYIIVHRKGRPQCCFHILIIQHCVIPQCFSVPVFKRVNNDLLVRITVHIETIPFRDLALSAEINFFTASPRFGCTNRGYLPTKEVPRFCGVSTPGGSASGSVSLVFCDDVIDLYALTDIVNSDCNLTTICGSSRRHCNIIGRIKISRTNSSTINLKCHIASRSRETT